LAHMADALLGTADPARSGDREDSTDLATLWTLAGELGEMIKRSVYAAEYAHWKAVVGQDAEAQALIREFAKAKERFAECERYGRFHPDYNEALDQVYAWERRLNEVECIRRFKAAEEALDRLLYEVSLTLARAVSDTIKVPDNDPNPKGCGNGGRCSCSGGCG